MFSRMDLRSRIALSGRVRHTGRSAGAKPARSNAWPFGASAFSTFAAQVGEYQRLDIQSEPFLACQYGALPDLADRIDLPEPDDQCG